MTRLGGFYYKDGERHQLALVQNATVAAADVALRLCQSDGLVELTSRWEDGEKRTLTIYCADSRYLPMLGFPAGSDPYTDEYVVMTLHDESLPARLISMVGDPYPEQATTGSIELVLEIVARFIKERIHDQLTAS